MKTRNLEVDRYVRFGADGKSFRIRRTVGSPLLRVKKSVDHIINRLIELGQIDVVEAFAEGRISAAELLHMDREGAQGRLTTLADIRLSRAIWDRGRAKGAASTALSTLKRGSTRTRYETSMTKLRKQAPESLGPTATLRHLEKVDWHGLAANWPDSPSDYMHVRRAVSRVLTIVLGSEHHPFRLSVMAKMPTVEEVRRVPTLTPEDFQKVVDCARIDVVDAFWTLVITGARLGEFLALESRHLNASTRTVRIPGTKTKGSRRDLELNAEFWGHVERAVPCHLKETGLRKQWKAACAAAEVDYCTLHDLRHCHAQWAVDAGAADSRVQDSLGHSSAAMTRRYSKKASTIQVSDVLAGVLKGSVQKHAGKSAGSAQK